MAQTTWTPTWTQTAWTDKLTEWESGVPQSYPSGCQHAFFYETSVCNRDGASDYNEVFVDSPELFCQSKLVPTLSAFWEYMKPSVRDNEHAVAFNSLSPGTRLVVPIPRKGKRFTNMKEFVDTASHRHQVQFWKLVAEEVRKHSTKHGRTFVSTHGLGVNYFHLRIECYPKYYSHRPFVEDI